MPDTKSPYDDEVRDPYDADDTKNPHEETEGAEEPDGGDGDGDVDGDAPPRRRPGRPRKVAQ